jgi:acetyl-CoA carboxylase biotin carboxyl carrier protein
MHEIRELIKLVDQSSITKFDYEFEGLKVCIKKGTIKGTQIQAVSSVQGSVPQHVDSTPVQTPAQATSVSTSEPVTAAEENSTEKDTAGLHKIVSPMVGTYYSSPSPDSPAYVKVGDKVNDSSVVCIVEAMKLMNEIEAEVRGEIVEILVQNGQLVEYGQPLFLVKPE